MSIEPRSEPPLVAVALSLTAAAAQDDPRYPDWSGQWRKVTMGARRATTREARRLRQQAPLKEEYRPHSGSELADQARVDRGSIIMSVKCIPMGMPYHMSIVFPFEFVITQKATYILLRDHDLATPPHLHRRPRLAEGHGSDLHRLFDRQVGRPGRRRHFDVLEIETSHPARAAPVRPDRHSIS